ncbi:Hypothetical predicted protein [Cloeon dipterum]|uniref:Protein kinase domain-containing protein n=1 Tax=Cloeon dipterum TaxID=197152 RepID=A0A8S1DVL1_9INSE|nr:Hypothetical predicted protein [Cloeon dipterum]
MLSPLVLLAALATVGGGPEEATGLRRCPRGHYKLADMAECAPMLTCPQLGSLQVGKLIGVGGVKAVYNATWRDQTVALSILNNRRFAEDFAYGQQMQLLYSGLPNFIQVVGFCEKPALTLTEYHPLGSLANLSAIVANYNLEDDVRFRLRLCRGWADILRILHGEGPIKETRVMCDSNSISKLLSQVLLEAVTLEPVLNDVDALPVVGPGGVICGSGGPLEGDLVAPEQRWPFPDLPYNAALMPGYSEKADIWKAGVVCEHLLNVTGGAWARYRLFRLHRRCRHEVPALRPCAAELHAEYSNALAELTRDEL